MPEYDSQPQNHLRIPELLEFRRTLLDMVESRTPDTLVLLSSSHIDTRRPLLTYNNTTMQKLAISSIHHVHPCEIT